jgi:hypothetical protein
MVDVEDGKTVFTYPDSENDDPKDDDGKKKKPALV